MGPEVKKLEEGLAAYWFKICLACGSGTGASYALMAIDIDPGGEVITTLHFCPLQKL